MPKLKKTNNLPVSGYMYLTDYEFYTLENNAKKDESMKEFLNSFTYYRSQQGNSNNKKFIDAARKLYYTEDETFLFDDDSNVSYYPDGAYVQGWVWVNKNQINKKRG